jgi:hypothetical protein
MNKILYECTAFNSVGLIAMQSKATNEIDAIRYCKTDLRDKLWKSKTQFYYDLRNFNFKIERVE